MLRVSLPKQLDKLYKTWTICSSNLSKCIFNIIPKLGKSHIIEKKQSVNRYLLSEHR